MATTRDSIFRLGVGRVAIGLALLMPVTNAVAQPADGTPPAAPPAATEDATESMAQSTTTDADMTDAQARAHFRLGREYYEQGRFAEAAKEFEVAYGLSGRSSLLYNVYLAYRDAQDTPNAARALRGYLAAVPNIPDHDHLVARLAALDGLLKEAQANEQRQQAEAQAAEQKAQAAERERAASEKRAADAERRAQARPSRPFWPWLLVGGGVVLAGTGIVLGSLAAMDGDELRDQCVADPRLEGAMAPLMRGSACAPSVDLESRRDSIQTRATIGDALWIGGAVVGVTGLVLAFALPDEYPELESPPVTAGCSSRRCQATFRFAF